MNSYKNIRIFDKKNDTCYKLKKNLFGKVHYVKINKDEFYSFKANKTEFIFPIIEGISFEEFLLNKISYDFKNRKSDFNRKILINITNFEKNMNEKILKIETSKGIKKDLKVYHGNLFFSFKLKDSKNQVINKNDIKIFLTNYTTPVNYSAEFLEDIISVAISGIYSNARQKNNYINIINSNETVKSEDLNAKPYYCSVCKEKFNNLDELLSHIIETKHKDNIFDEYPYDDELLKIKKQLNF